LLIQLSVLHIINLLLERYRNGQYRSDGATLLSGSDSSASTGAGSGSQCYIVKLNDAEAGNETP
jgi:hypothetical protein